MVGGDKQNDFHGCWILATPYLKKGGKFVDYVTTYHEGKLPKSFWYEQGQYIAIDSKAYIDIHPSYFEFTKEPQQKWQVANVECGIHHEKSHLKQQLKVKILSDVKEDNWIICIYDAKKSTVTN